MSAFVEVRAPAKLTLSLRVTGVRPDGYHLIDAEMVTLDLADELLIEEGEIFGQAVSMLEIVDDGGRVHDQVDTGPGNLVMRALASCGRTAFVRVTKRVPPGAGLGGGSADAAAVLRWAGFTDLAAAATLGADVPFCVVGGRARVRGIGELIEPLPFVERTFTLLTPPFGCSTPEVYAAWDRLGGPTADGPNDLEAAALAVEPGLVVYRDRLGDRTGRTPVLAGSGSTWFVEGAHEGAGFVVAHTIPAASTT